VSDENLQTVLAGLGLWNQGRFESVTLEPGRRTSGGDEVVIEAHFLARGRHGADVDIHAYQRYTLRDGKLVRFEAYPSWEEAIAASGLDLEPSP
jgi:hypothetical protein